MAATRKPPDELRSQATAERRAVRTGAIAVAVAVLLAAGAVAFGTARGRDTQAGSPVGTVRSFLIGTAIDHNGVDGCRYLTVEARRRLQDAQSPHTSCEIALSHRQLTLGGRTLDNEAAVKALSYRGQQHGPDARVAVSANGASLTFGLHRATAGEVAGFQPPPTDWRIDSGVQGLAGW
jgi:hypothetical protein